jgi:hypothetical protein
VAIDRNEILDVLNRSAFFPMMDNGYVYLAANRLSLFRSETDWAIVVETFGYSPRAGLPDTSIATFASKLHDRNPPEGYVSRNAYENYLANHPNDEMRYVHPIEAGDWQGPDEFVADDGQEIVLRGQPFPLPSLQELAQQGIEFSEPPHLSVFELCRYLAAVAREKVLATPAERRISVLPEMQQILQLEEWNHPDLTIEPPSSSPTFHLLAGVLETGDVSMYRSTLPPNTHWRNWPMGGTL